MLALASWGTTLISVGAGAGGAAVALWQAWRLLPWQQRQLKADASEARAAETRAAVETVNAALDAARGRIDTLERRVSDMTTLVGELRGELNHEQTRSKDTERKLDLALAERANLAQQVTDLQFQVKSRTPLTRDPAEAILLVGLADGVITYANDGVFSLLGYIPEELVGQNIDQLVPETLRANHKSERAGFAAHPVARPMSTSRFLTARKRDGSTVSVEISLLPTGDGRVATLLKQRAAS